MQASFSCCINEGSVLVRYHYDWDDVGCCDIECVEFAGQDVKDILHPEDYDYILDMCPERAAEHKAEEVSRHEDQ